MGNELLAIRDLTVEFPAPKLARAVRHVSFEVMSGEIVAIVGESGSGKSVTALSILGMAGDLGAQVTSGSVNFQGVDLLAMREKQIRAIRGSLIGMVFQDPLSSLDPVFSIGWQIAEAIRIHNPGVTKRQALERVVALLFAVGIPEPRRLVHNYPHEFSGGMRQRVLMAMAIANSPRLLIADEPTTALDVTVQAQILELIRQVRDDERLGVIFITHDLGVVAEIADRVLVMYAGQIVESADVFTLFSMPQHPYTRGLMTSRATLGAKRGALSAISGQPPRLTELREGCSFLPRCSHSSGRKICASVTPVLEQRHGGGLVACHFASEFTSGLEEVTD